MSAARRLRLGFSPCPNDTFQFHALVHGHVALPGIEILPVLDDIEGLNERALDPARALEITKLSLPAFAAARERYRLLGAGAALGFGVGPLVVARPGGARELAELGGARVAIPGRWTTAWLLYRRYAPPPRAAIAMRFDRILGAVAGGEVDAGLIIHESRFTYAAHGLVALADLGREWESRERLPLPLAVIAVRADQPAALDAELTAAIRRSVEYAQADPAPSRDYVRAHARELADDVRDAHVRLYVNRYSLALGADGEAAVERILAT